jgi:diguanylate cyclase (GGDEF)-like protein
MAPEPVPASRRRVVLPAGRETVVIFGVLGLVLVGYWVSVVAHGGGSPTGFDGWFVDSTELAASAVCLTSAVVRPQVRSMALALGLALLSWTVGDWVLTVESMHGAKPPVPSLADAFYLGFYPLAYVAAFLFMRNHLRGLPARTWLDGLVGGLGAVAACAAFAFHDLHTLTGGSTAKTATELAYPIGDLLLLGLMAGGLAMVPRSGKLVWALLAGGMAVIGVGDTVNLFFLSSPGPGPAVADVLDAVAWPTGACLISAAPWWQGRVQRGKAAAHPPDFAVPAGAGTCALGIVLIASAHRTDIPQTAVALAAATLVAAGARFLLSVEALRAVSVENQLQAVTDELTGAHNRRYMRDMLDDYFARRAEGDPVGDLAFLFVDLDHFKEINDTFGHPAGDDLLRQLGARLQGSLRPADVTVRVGGDEFALLLRDADPGFATEVAQKVMTVIGQPFALQTVNARIGASIGIAMASWSANRSELMWSADTAMYRAKQAGTGYCLYGEGAAAGTDSLRLTEELRVAVGSGQLELHYQPLLDLQSGEVTGVEALLRWLHPRLGMVPPLEFLPLAEEAGLMSDITQFVLSEALTQVARWRESGQHLAVSVNISPDNLPRRWPAPDPPPRRRRPRAGDNRDDGGEGFRQVPGGDRKGKAPGRGGLDRRLRCRGDVARLLVEPGRCRGAQTRPWVHSAPVPSRGPARARVGESDHRTRPQHGAPGGGRGYRRRRHPGAADRVGLRRCPGLPHQPAQAGA